MGANWADSMPALPDEDAIARGLHKRVARDRIEADWIGKKKEPLQSPAARIAAVLDGAHVEQVRRIGKHIVFDLSDHKGNKNQWIVHLGMTGRMLVAAPETELANHTHLVARLK